MPRGHSLLIGREVTEEIFQGPHLALGVSAVACFCLFLWLQSVGGGSGELASTATIYCLIGPSVFGVLLPGCVFYFYTTLSVRAHPLFLNNLLRDCTCISE